MAYLIKNGVKAGVFNFVYNVKMIQRKHLKRDGCIIISTRRPYQVAGCAIKLTVCHFVLADLMG